MYEKEIGRFLADGGKIKQLPDQIVISKNETKFHFANEPPLKINQPKPITLSDSQLSKLPKITQRNIKSKRYKALKRKILLKEMNKQKRLNRLTTIHKE